MTLAGTYYVRLRLRMDVIQRTWVRYNLRVVHFYKSRPGPDVFYSEGGFRQLLNYNLCY